MAEQPVDNSFFQEADALSAQNAQKKPQPVDNSFFDEADNYGKQATKSQPQNEANNFQSTPPQGFGSISPFMTISPFPVPAQAQSVISGVGQGAGQLGTNLTNL